MSIFNDIIKYIRDSGYTYTQCYVGIASSPENRLFKDHNVLEKGGIWIYRNAGSSNQARLIEKQLLALGFQGGDGGGDISTKYVYAYAIRNYTRQ